MPGVVRDLVLDVGCRYSRFFISEKAMDLSLLMLKNYKKEIKGNGSRVVARDDRGQSGNDNEVNPPYPSLGNTRDMPLLKGAYNVDIYFIHWLAGLAPLYDAGGVYEKFIQANLWLNNYLPNWSPNLAAARRQVGPLKSEFYHDIMDLLFGGLEPQFKALQLKLLPPRLKDLMNLDGRVVINDETIKLHANDRREEYREKFKEKINNLSLR